MSHLVIFATVLSRLHADLAVVRLKQAGISTASLSVLYSPSSRPNSGLCWLNGSTRMSLSSGEAVAVSGRLRVELANGDEHGSLQDRLEHLGLNNEQSTDLEESLRQNQLVLAVEVCEEETLISAFQVLDGLAAEKIIPVGIHTKPAKAAAHHRHAHAAPSLSTAGLAFSV